MKKKLVSAFFLFFQNIIRLNQTQTRFERFELGPHHCRSRMHTTVRVIELTLSRVRFVLKTSRCKRKPRVSMTFSIFLRAHREIRRRFGVSIARFLANKRISSRRGRQTKRSSVRPLSRCNRTRTVRTCTAVAD